MLHGEHAREPRGAPTGEHEVQHLRPIRRIGERHVVGIAGERCRERDRVALEYTRLLQHAQCGNVRLQRMQAGGPELHEVGAARSARQRLESERTGTGEEVEHPRVLDILSQHVEHADANELGRGPHARIGWREQVPPRVFPANNSHRAKLPGWIIRSRS